MGCKHHQCRHSRSWGRSERECWTVLLSFMVKYGRLNSLTSTHTLITHSHITDECKQLIKSWSTHRARRGARGTWRWNLGGRCCSYTCLLHVGCECRPLLPTPGWLVTWMLWVTEWSLRDESRVIMMVKVKKALIMETKHLVKIAIIQLEAKRINY